MKLKSTALVCWLLLSLSLEGKTYHTAYGEVEVKEPVLIELIDSPPMQRLKDVHQYGVGYYMNHTKEWYSRYDHSMGVFMILRTYGAPLKEQIAGLLHDTSHTAFSHLGDFVFDFHSTTRSYQDNIHKWFLEKTELEPILEKHGYQTSDVLPDHDAFKALERPLPYLCADRLDYNIQGAFLHGDLTYEEMIALFNDLQFDGEVWSFSNQALAAKLAKFSLHMTEDCWSSIQVYLGNTWLKDALMTALKLGLIKMDDISFGTDEALWEMLQASKDPAIKERLERINNVSQYYKVAVQEKEDLLIGMKFRGIDPLLRTESGYKMLTEQSHDYALEYYRVKAITEKGWQVCLVVPEE